MAAILAVATIHNGVSVWQDPYGLKDGESAVSVDDVVTLLVSIVTVMILARFRSSGNVLAKGAFIAALANLATDVFDTTTGAIISLYAPPWLTLANRVLAVVLTGVAAAAVVKEAGKGKVL